VGVILEKLEQNRILISGGGLGTSLQALGLTPGECPELWNVTRAEEVRSVHRGFVEAGSDIILTNTFGGSGIKLAKSGLQDRVAELNSAGARNALEEAGEDVIVAGSIGPTGEFLEPLGTLSLERMQEAFYEQIIAILEAGVRAICVETMADADEAACAVRAAKQIDPDVDVIATFTFKQGPDGFRTIMGIDPKLAVEKIAEAGADIAGSNCGEGIDTMVPLAQELKKHTGLPILIHSNAGVPELVDGRTVFRQGPEQFAASARALVEAGASIIGGCCGTTFDHIAAMKAAVT
jgi:5-methyltetrahydrofolate--homocysteine methyltransferase